VFFANSGAEANEGAIKLARKFGTLYKGGAHEIITFVRRLPRPHARDHVGIRQEGF
jgi:Ornithine/acetylornithine aminotransferase